MLFWWNILHLCVLKAYYQKDKIFWLKSDFPIIFWSPEFSQWVFPGCHNEYLHIGGKEMLLYRRGKEMSLFSTHDNHMSFKMLPIRRISTEMSFLTSPIQADWRGLSLLSLRFGQSSASDRSFLRQQQKGLDEFFLFLYLVLSLSPVKW